MSASSRQPLCSLASAWDYLDQRTTPLAATPIPLAEAAGRVLSAALFAPLPQPPFRRAMMDGYAVRAADLQHATAQHPVTLEVVATLLAGATEAEPPLLAGQAIRVATGAQVPRAADAVIPSEMTRVLNTAAVDCSRAEQDGPSRSGTAGQASSGTPRSESLVTSQQPVPNRIAALAAVSVGKHLAEPGEDIATGQLLCAAGTSLRATDLGVLAALGFGTVSVVRAPRVAVLITGSELLPRGTPLPWGNGVVDANGPLLEALIQRDGGVPLTGPLLPDDPQLLRAALEVDADLVVLVGGSSVGPADFARELVTQQGELPIRGIDIRPSRPTCLGMHRDRLLAILPGPPGACLVAYELLVGRAIRRLAGRGVGWPYRSQVWPLGAPLVSQRGRVDYTRVHTRAGHAWPVAGTPNSLAGQLAADGFLLVPAEAETLPVGTSCEVWLY